MYLIFYDISDDKLRTKVNRLLKQAGYEFLQYSVFVGISPPYNLGLWQKIKRLLEKTPTEKVFCLKVSKENVKNISIIGDFQEDIDYICGDKSSLIF